MQERKLAYLQIHTAVILFGFTGILGDVISLPKPAIVWWRMLLTVLSLLVIPGVWKQARRLPRDAWLRIAGVGVLVAFHWLLFFGAIGVTNVSVTLACLASTSFFTALSEPLIRRTKLQWYELAMGLAVIPGVAMIYSASDFAFGGIAMALGSAILAAIFSTLNKKLLDTYDPVSITLLELGSGWLVLCLLAPLYLWYEPEAWVMPTQLDWLYLAILAFLCTSFAFIITLRALKVLTTFAINLTVNLEPVYAIILAWLLLGEDKELGAGFYFGAGVIILAVFSYPVINRRLRRKSLH